MNRYGNASQTGKYFKKVMDGFRLAHKRLVEKAKGEDDTLVIERDGKPVYVRACDL
ncbi:hypothetical protein [Spirosoma radiotolerans]|uniref:hypothetical protein n=1 Tax=Spirosoma radiotolerans TaxID=1379870 RepID=UPI001D113513|nr:hypothetical protein [Spirosoma radiotolerans]